MGACSVRAKPALVCAAALLGLGLSLLLWRDVNRMQRQAGRLEIEREQLSILQRDAAKERRRMQLIRQKNDGDADDGMPAIVLLQRLGAAWTADISLLRLVSDLPKRRLQLQILARSNDALFDFIARLKQQVGERAFVERQADRSSDDAEWALDASVVVAW